MKQILSFEGEVASKSSSLKTKGLVALALSLAFIGGTVAIGGVDSAIDAINNKSATVTQTVAEKVVPSAQADETVTVVAPHTSKVVSNPATRVQSVVRFALTKRTHRFVLPVLMSLHLAGDKNDNNTNHFTTFVVEAGSVVFVDDPDSNRIIARFNAVSDDGLVGAFSIIQNYYSVKNIDGTLSLAVNGAVYKKTAETILQGKNQDLYRKINGLGPYAPPAKNSMRSGGTPALTVY